MKEFLRKLFVFILILCTYFGLNFMINKAVFYLSAVPVEEVNLLIAGDSYPQYSLNPKLLNSAQNISQLGEPYVITYWKLKYLLPKIKVDTIIIGFAHHNISAFNDMKFSDKKWSSEMFARIYLIHQFEQMKELQIDRDEFYKVYIRKMLLYPKSNHYDFIGKFSTSSQNYKADFESGINRHFTYNNRSAGISEISIAYLDSIIHLCEKSKLTTILIGCPVHEEYFKRIPQDVKNRYEREKEKLIKQRIVLIDLTDRFYEDEYYFNSDHLNEKGATKFTAEIQKILKN